MDTIIPVILQEAVMYLLLGFAGSYIALLLFRHKLSLAELEIIRVEAEVESLRGGSVQDTKRVIGVSYAGSFGIELGIFDWPANFWLIRRAKVDEVPQIEDLESVLKATDPALRSLEREAFEVILSYGTGTLSSYTAVLLGGSVWSNCHSTE